MFTEDKIKEDLKSNAMAIGNCISDDSSAVKSFNLIIDHIQHNQPYIEALNTNFASIVEWCAYQIYDNRYENLRQTLGHELITDESIRKDLIYLFEHRYPFTTKNIENDEITIHKTLILPLFSNFILVEEQEDQIDRAIAIPIDYPQLSEDNEF